MLNIQFHIRVESITDLGMPTRAFQHKALRWLFLYSPLIHSIHSLRFVQAA